MRRVLVENMPRQRKITLANTSINDVFGAMELFSNPFASHVALPINDLINQLNENEHEFYHFSSSSTGYVLVRYFYKLVRNVPTYDDEDCGEDSNDILYVSNFEVYSNKKYYKIHRFRNTFRRVQYRNTSDALKMLRDKIIFYQEPYDVEEDCTLNHPREFKLFVLNELQDFELELLQNTENKCMTPLEFIITKWCNVLIKYTWIKN